MFHSFVISALNRGEWSGSHRGTRSPRESAPWYSLKRSLGGPQSRCGLFGERKITCLILVSFSTTPRPTLGPTRPPTHRIPPAFLRRVKQPTNEPDHLSVCNAVVLTGSNPDLPCFTNSLCLVKRVGYPSSVYFMVINIKILPVPLAAWSKAYVWSR